MPTLFRNLAVLCEQLESTKKRKTMADWVASFIQQLQLEEVQPATSMLMGRAFPTWDRRVLEISWPTISTIIRRITNAEEGSFSQAFGVTGDAGDATETLYEKGKTRRQVTLFQRQLTILEVNQAFETIAATTGPGSREKKERLLETLLSSATPLEAKYIVRILARDMRTGFHEGLMERAVAQAFNVPLCDIQTANMLMGDIGEVAALLRARGKEGLSKLGFRVFRPIRPMMAQMAETVAEAWEEHNKKTALEYKLDGARVQVHKSGDNVKIFSRRLTDVTESLPEIVEQVKNEVKTAEAVLEGEIIAVSTDGNLLPFQHLMRRFRRIRKIELAAEEIPVQLHLFDVLFIDGKNLVREPYIQRREKLIEVAGSIPLTRQIIAESVEDAEGFLQGALERGHEGVMAKRLDSPYTPGVRGKGWLKIKSVLDPLDLVIVAAEYGYGRRHGWLSDYYLAARDAESGELLTVGKTFKGLTDAEIIRMTQLLKQLTIGKEGHRVTVAPRITVEVAYNEIQKSSKYRSGMALRFARITRIRDDKSPEEADTIQRVREIFERQFGKKAKYHEG